MTICQEPSPRERIRRPMETAEKSRRRREKVAVVILVAALVFLTAFEVHILKLSAKLPFVNSIFFFGLMNINIVLIMLLLFLVFRNVVKLILDEKRGRPGSRLRTRLVFSFILFAIIPTVLLFTISATYIKTSFDKWFSARVESTLQRSIEVVKIYYENTERNAQHFARRIATSLGPSSEPARLSRILEDLRLEYGLDGLEYYSSPFSPRVLSAHPDKAEDIPPGSLETLKEIFSGGQRCRVQNVGTGELVRCGVFLGAGKGALFADYFIPTSLASQLSEISVTYDEFKRNNPLDYPVKSTYFAVLTMVTLLILFAAIWTGFYVAKRLTVPVEELLRGTEEVARGNLNFKLTSAGRDELARLVDSFNTMVRDLRQNKVEIQKIERMSAWREVARRIAHEIKNPLTPIQLSVERLRRRYLGKLVDDGTFDQSTQIILKEVDALKSLVSEFTTFARLPEIVQSPEDINSIIIESTNLFRAARESIQFDLKLSDRLPMLRIDRGQLKRALINLFDNAVSAMNESGTISVETFENKPMELFCLSVADTGCGIHKTAENQLFEPYFSTKEGGTGLGLAIIQRIVSDHGGHIKVSKNAPRGTRFTIELPASLRYHPASPAASFDPQVDPVSMSGGEAPN